MMPAARSLLILALTCLTLRATASAAVSMAKVERSTPDTLSLTWTSPDPIDIYQSARPDVSLGNALLVVHGSSSGGYTVKTAGRMRLYFMLFDERDHQILKVAERLVPLEQGSNFRDLGGYPAAGAKHVRWGLIYRSGAQPMLTDQDLAQLRALGLAQLVDLRSNEERALAPTTINGVPYTAIGYSMAELVNSVGLAQIRNGVDVYRRFPHTFAPQLKVIFGDLLSGHAPIVYNCSAGQDRTGFVTAVILSALGVPRDQIYVDYLLSTADRRPEFEMPRIDLAAHPNDPVAQYYAKLQGDASGLKPQPLVDGSGRPFLIGAFEEIDAKWGSTDAYLRREVGLSDADRVSLQNRYLE
jgi:protein-tyrosine phosphatase